MQNQARLLGLVVLAFVLAAGCSPGTDGSLGEAEGSTPTRSPATTPTAPRVSSTTATAPATRGLGAEPDGPEEAAAVAAVQRWFELEDLSFAAGTADAVRGELETLLSGAADLVDLAVEVAGPIERTSRARVERIWQPEEGVIRMDVCRIIDVGDEETRSTLEVTATTGATPLLESVLVEDLARDGVACPPDEIIE